MNFHNSLILKKILGAGFIFAALALFSCASDPEAMNNDKERVTVKQLSDAEKRGIARAEADIKRGDLKILYYGERLPEDDYPQFDKETGLRMVNEEWDDLPSNDYPEEVAAYNRTIRAYVKKKRSAIKSGEK